MIIEEEVYLEHFGKRGMKWGQRNERLLSGVGLVSTVGLGMATIHSLGNSSWKKNLTLATATTAFGLGTAMTMKILNKNGKHKMSKKEMKELENLKLRG